MANAFFLTQRVIDEKNIQLKHLVKILEKPSKSALQYYIKSRHLAIKNQMEEVGLIFIDEKDYSNWSFRQQEVKVFIEGIPFRVLQLANPDLDKIRQKNNGIVFDNNYYLQIKETVLFDERNKELYLFEYAYHFGKYNEQAYKDDYFFRYDRDVRESNPPKKEIEHLHVMHKHPHFKSGCIEFTDVVNILDTNWDREMKELKF